MKPTNAPEDQIEPAIEHRAPRRRTARFSNLDLTLTLAGALAVGAVGGALVESKLKNSALGATGIERARAEMEQQAWDTVIASAKINEPALCVQTCKEGKDAKSVTSEGTLVDKVSWITLIEIERGRAAPTTGNDCTSICEKLNKEVCARIAAVSQTEAAQTTLCNPAGKTPSATPSNEK